MFGEMGREFRLDFLKIAAGHSWADVHLVGMQGCEPALAAPEVEDPGVVEEGQQKVLVIACQGDDRRWPFVGCKLFEHAPRAGTAIDVIAQENRHGMVKRPSLDIRLDALSHVPEQVVTTMDVANAVNQSPIRHPTRSRNRRRSLKGLKERIRPPREFSNPYFSSRVVHLDRSE